MDGVLDYAAPVPWFRRRRVRRALAAGGLLVALGMMGVMGYVERGRIREGWVQYQFIRAQDAAFEASTDQGRIVFSEKPADVAALAGKRGYLRVDYLTPDAYSAVVYSSDAWRHYLHQPNRFGSDNRISPNTAPLYARRIRIPGGREYLAVVLVGNRLRDCWPYTFCVIEPATIRTRTFPTEGLRHSTIMSTSEADKGSIRLYSATPDEADGMSFTAAYEWYEKMGHIRGTISAPTQGASTGPPSVELKVLDGPLQR
jgi:hypothetical protein